MREGKDLSIGLLLDYYSEMLTEKQRDAVELYYSEDLSLSEIADLRGITRQGARELIKRGEEIMQELEGKLHMSEKSAQLDGIILRLEEINKNSPAGQELDDVIGGLKQIF